VEESRIDYYEALRRSSEGWHESQHDLLPWLQHFLAILRRAYRELDSRIGKVKPARGAKTALLEAAIAQFPGEFSLADLERASPGVSRDLARRVLRQLQSRGAVKCLGRGPGAAWIARRGNSEIS
jgi:Fic family protein